MLFIFFVIGAAIFAYFIDPTVAGLFLLLANFVYLYFSSKKPYPDNLCKITLEDAALSYEELNGSYSVNVEYDQIEYVKYQEVYGTDCVYIGVGKLSELKCSSIPNARELVSELNVRAKL